MSALKFKLCKPHCNKILAVETTLQDLCALITYLDIYSYILSIKTKRWTQAEYWSTFEFDINNRETDNWIISLMYLESKEKCILSSSCAMLTAKCVPARNISSEEKGGGGTVDGEARSATPASIDRKDFGEITSKRAPRKVPPSIAIATSPPSSSSCEVPESNKGKEKRAYLSTLTA